MLTYCQNGTLECFMSEEGHVTSQFVYLVLIMAEKCLLTHRVNCIAMLNAHFRRKWNNFSVYAMHKVMTCWTAVDPLLIRFCLALWVQMTKQTFVLARNTPLRVNCLRFLWSFQLKFSRKKKVIHGRPMNDTWKKLIAKNILFLQVRLCAHFCHIALPEFLL